ncbi:MAG: hypothetical protein V2A79_04785 [Planctomycetota bacterium]
MALLDQVLSMIVFLGPIAMVAYMLRVKLGLTKPSHASRRPHRHSELQPPPLVVVVAWVAALVVLILSRILAR